VPHAATFLYGAPTTVEKRRCGCHLGCHCGGNWRGELRWMLMDDHGRKSRGLQNRLRCNSKFHDRPPWSAVVRSVGCHLGCQLLPRADLATRVEARLTQSVGFAVTRGSADVRSQDYPALTPHLPPARLHCRLPIAPRHTSRTVYEPLFVSNLSFRRAWAPCNRLYTEPLTIGKMR
jgi:hypothetical protein